MRSAILFLVVGVLTMSAQAEEVSFDIGGIAVKWDTNYEPTITRVDVEAVLKRRLDSATQVLGAYPKTLIVGFRPEADARYIVTYPVKGQHFHKLPLAKADDAATWNQLYQRWVKENGIKLPEGRVVSLALLAEYGKGVSAEHMKALEKEGPMALNKEFLPADTGKVPEDPRRFYATLWLMAWDDFHFGEVGTDLMKLKDRPAPDLKEAYKRALAAQK